MSSHSHFFMIGAASLLLTASLAAQIQLSPNPKPPPPDESQAVSAGPSAAAAWDPSLSPAERAITVLRKQIAAAPNSHSAYAELAIALARRARETSDTAYYQQAEEAIARSLAIRTDNFEALKARAWVLLGRHEFAKALEVATRLNQQRPDDVMVYGFLTDANVELGNYKQAEAAAQWMLDLRPGNLPALTRAAYLRELFGDLNGSLDLMNMAYNQTQFTENEERAWILSQIAHLQLAAGQYRPAEQALQLALRQFPDYHYALGNLGRVRMAEKRYNDAAELFARRAKRAPHAENLFELGAALQLAGRKDEARRVFAEFEAKALKESLIADNSNHELVFYYADFADQPAEALRIAQAEYGRRKDVFTSHALAWALYRNGQFADARRVIDGALAVGVRDSSIFYHAGLIAAKLGDQKAAGEFLRKSAELNSTSSGDAQLALAQLPGR